MRLAILSDLHVSSSDDPVYARLLDWIAREAQGPGDVLVLAGDIFDLYVGDKRVFRERYARFHQALAAAGRAGAEIHYVEGNHDFHLTRAFAAIPGMRVWPESVSLRVDGVPLFVAHGDRVDPTDWGYRLLRFLFRSFAMRVFARWAPDAWIEAIGKRLSLESQKHSVRLPESLPAERLARLRGWYHAASEARFARGDREVVMGHCHDRDERTWQIGGERHAYWNVGYPRAHGTAIRWNPQTRQLERVSF